MKDISKGLRRILFEGLYQFKNIDKKQRVKNIFAERKQTQAISDKVIFEIAESLGNEGLIDHETNGNEVKASITQKGIEYYNNVLFDPKEDINYHLLRENALKLGIDEKNLSGSLSFHQSTLDYKSDGKLKSGHFNYHKLDDNHYKIDFSPPLRSEEDFNRSSLKGNQVKSIFIEWVKTIQSYDKKIVKGGQKNQDISKKVLKHTLSTDVNDKSLERGGYRNQGLIGFIHENKRPNTKPLWHIHIQGNLDDHFFYFDKEVETPPWKQSTKPKIIGYIPNKESVDQIELKRFFNKSTFDHFYCSQPIQEIESYGYNDEKKEFNTAWLLINNKQGDCKPLFVYSKTPDVLLFEPFEELSEIEPVDLRLDSDADILPDTIAKKDSLGRQNLMEIVFDKVNKLWEELNEDQSFTILLNGEWGSGKSSMLYYFEQFLSDNKWSVVQYNAWENQRFDEPWWILVNKVSKEVPQKCQHSHWIWKNKLQYSITYIGAFVTSVLLIIGLSNGIFKEVENVVFIGSILALLGSLWVTVNGAIQNIFKKRTFSTMQAKNANDPFEPVKERFKEVVKHKNVAIFIDDLDRCEVDATVKLLEGIQTLFKNSKVLYVIAADGHWVSNCFDRKYNEFDGLASDGQTIGNQFLQKTFQLIVDVPKLSKPKQQVLLNEYLKREGENKQEPTSEEQINQEIEEAQTLEQVGRASEGKGIKASKRAAERAGEIIEQDKEHYMQKLLEDDLMPANPRQMIRLINLFTLKIQELVLSEVLNDVGEENVLKYILFSTEYPEYNHAIQHLEEEKLNEKYPDLKDKLGSLEIEMIKDYL